MEASKNQELRPCRICVDFYGTAETDFLCSKCIKEQASQSHAAQSETQEPVQQQQQQQLCIPESSSSQQ